MFYSSKFTEEKKIVFTQILISTTVFNWDNNKKCFLSTIMSMFEGLPNTENM